MGRRKQKERKYLSSYEIEQEGIRSKVAEYYEFDEKNLVYDIPLHYGKA